MQLDFKNILRRITNVFLFNYDNRIKNLENSIANLWEYTHSLESKLSKINSEPRLPDRIETDTQMQSNPTLKFTDGITEQEWFLESENDSVSMYYDRGFLELSRINKKTKIFDSSYNILELYCKAGKNSRAFSENVNSYTGIDPSEVFVNFAKSMNIADNVAFNILNQDSWTELSNNTFDIILYRTDRKKWSARIVKEIILQLKCILHNDSKFIFLSPYSIEEMAAVGLEIDKLMKEQNLSIVDKYTTSNHKIDTTQIVIERKKNVTSSTVRAGVL